MTANSRTNNFFDAGSPYLTHPLLTSDRTSAEIDKVLAFAGDSPIPNPKTALDIGCGFGRHSIELASRGLTVTGIDPSATMIENARGASEAAANKDLINFRVQRGQDLSEVDSFDLAICLFTTLGQQGNAGEASTSTAASDEAALLTRVHQACRPGATLVVEVPERERALDALVATEALGPTDVSRRFDDQAGILHERFETPGGTFDLAYQLFSADELTSLLRTAGFVDPVVTPSALAPPPPTFMTVVAYA